MSPPENVYTNIPTDGLYPVLPVYESLNTEALDHGPQAEQQESAATQPNSTTEDQNEPVQTRKPSWLSFAILHRDVILLLFVAFIMLISIVTFILVILVIAGKLGPCSQCSNTRGLLSKFEDKSSTSFLPLYHELNALKQNFSILSTQMNQKISHLQAELNEAKWQIQHLPGNMTANEISALWALANTTKDQLHSETTRLQKGINNAIDTCKADNTQLTSKLKTLRSKEQNDVTTLQKDINNIVNRFHAGSTLGSSKMWITSYFLVNVILNYLNLEK